MSSQSPEASGPQQIPIQQLPLAQIEQFKKQVEEEIAILTDSVSQLKMAQQKFSDSLDNLDVISPTNAGKEIMVPMTSSMYVPGLVDDCEMVLVDVGTGYFVEKSVEAAQQYFRRKIEFVGKQLEKIHPTLLDKQRVRNALAEAYAAKFAQVASAQQVQA